jgi:hypothetical protein
MTNGMKSDDCGLPVALIYTRIKGRNNFIADVKESPQSDKFFFLISKRILLKNAKRNQVYRGYTRETIKKKKKAIQGNRYN